MDPYAAKRRWMVDSSIEARGIRDPAVLDAMRSVPRHVFVPPEMEALAYEDAPLPIGEGQTISQPYVVALMTEALRLGPSDRVLEIGTGSGYAAAVASRIASEVYTIERHPALAREAQATLAELGYTNVHVVEGDGTLGWREDAPYEAIVVTAGGPRIPEALLWQLAEGGRLVIPIGPHEAQRLFRITHVPGSGFQKEDLGDVRFVPLIGQGGWGGSPGRG